MVVDSGDPQKGQKCKKHIFCDIEPRKILIVYKPKQNWIVYRANTLMMKNIHQNPGVTLYVIIRAAPGGSFQDGTNNT